MAVVLESMKGAVRLNRSAVKTTNFTLASGELAPVDLATTGSVVATMPPNPVAGETYCGVEIEATHASRVCTWSRNSLNVEGGTDVDPYALYYLGERIIWFYAGATLGWVKHTDGRKAGFAEMTRSTAKALVTAVFTNTDLATSVSDSGGLVDTTNHWILTRRKAHALVRAFGVHESSGGTANVQTLVACFTGTGTPAEAFRSGTFIGTSGTPARRGGGDRKFLDSLPVATKIELHMFHNEGADRNTSTATSSIYPRLTYQEVLAG